MVRRAYTKVVTLLTLFVLGSHFHLLPLGIFQGTISMPLLTLDSSAVSHQQNVINIVYWNKFRGFSNYSFGFGMEPFVKAGCKVSACNATYSKDELHKADALLFHVPDYGQQKHNRIIPHIRLPHQKYVFFVRESPRHSVLKMREYNGFFNVSMTYSRHADIHFPYGKIGKRTTPFPEFQSDFYSQQGLLKSKNDSRFALALISDCRDRFTYRLGLIKALQKHIPVDLYGKCQEKRKDMLKDEARDCFKKHSNVCARKWVSKYKFYFAFENSLCKEYATEKVFKVLDLPVIPVVYGGANYSQILPKNSFINVRDFVKIKDLVSFLREVASDEKRYFSYFKWRADYEQLVKIDFIRTPAGHFEFLRIDPHAMCDLCEYLHIHRHKKKVIDDLDALWGSDQNCFYARGWLRKFLT